MISNLLANGKFGSFKEGVSVMKAINEARLESDLAYRFSYLAEFMGFGPTDQEAIHGAASHLGPLVPSLVDAIYDKLHSFDATWRHFVPRQSGFKDMIRRPGKL